MPFGQKCLLWWMLFDPWPLSSHTASRLAAIRCAVCLCVCVGAMQSCSPLVERPRRVYHNQKHSIVHHPLTHIIWPNTHKYTSHTHTHDALHNNRIFRSCVCALYVDNMVTQKRHSNALNFIGSSVAKCMSMQCYILFFCWGQRICTESKI